jgi:uncharacterized protein
LSSHLRLRESKSGVLFEIHVNPYASRAEFAGVREGILKVKVTAPPVEGAANEACIKLLAKELGLKKSQLEIFAGAKGRKKTILVTDITLPELDRITKDLPAES